MHKSVPLRLPPQAAERESGIPVGQTMPERGPASPLGYNRPPTSTASNHTGSSTFSHRSLASPPSLSKQLLTGSSSSSGGAASDTSLNHAQTHYATAYSAAELGTFHCDRVRKMPLSELDPKCSLVSCARMRRIGLTFDRG